MGNIAKQELNNIGNMIPVARVDRIFNIIYANAAFYSVMEEAYFHSVYSILDEESAEHLKQSEDLLTPGESTELLVFLKKQQMYAFLSVILNDNDEFEIKMCPAGQMIEILEKGQVDQERYRAMLYLLGDALFEYDRETDYFKLYWIVREQDIIFYEGSLNTWMESCIREDRIHEGDVNVFRDFCRDLKEGTEHFNYKVRNNILLNSKLKETVHISGQSLLNYEKKSVTIGAFSIHNSVTGEKEDTLLEEVYIDSLTGIMTRAEAENYARRKIEERPIPADYAGQLFPEKSVALCIIDIDNFKSINDTYGHRFGDEVLREVAAILRKAAGVKGVPGRVGGDEFIMVLEDVKDELELRNILRVVRSGFQWLYPDKLQPVQFGCSIGVAMYPQDAENYESLYNIADNALYLAKAKGKNRYIIYDVKKHGKVAEGDYALTLVKNNLINYDVVDLGRLVKELIRDGKAGIPDFLEKLAGKYGIERIQIFARDYERPVYCYCKEGLQIVDEEMISDPHYLSLFKGGTYSAVSNVHELEYAEPKIYASFLEKKIESRFQYLIKADDGTTDGLITFDVCRGPVKWKQEIIDSLILVCSVLESLIG